jgi:hypothetical protein
MAYIGGVTFNIHGTTIHSSQIPFNCKDLPSLSSKCLYTLINKYDQVQLMVLDEISLIGNGILKCIDLQLRPIKRMHKLFLEILMLLL